MKAIRLNKSIEVFFVILIIIGLCISAVVLMDSGKKAYGRILDNNSQLENARIAISYISMRIRQNNSQDCVSYEPDAIDDSDAVILTHSGDLLGMVTYIYFKDGELRELFTWADGEPDPDFSEPIVSLKGFDVDNEDGYFKFTARYTEDGQEKLMEQIVWVIGN